MVFKLIVEFILSLNFGILIVVLEFIYIKELVKDMEIEESSDLRC